MVDLYSRKRVSPSGRISSPIGAGQLTSDPSAHVDVGPVLLKQCRPEVVVVEQLEGELLVRREVIGECVEPGLVEAVTQTQSSRTQGANPRTDPATPPRARRSTFLDPVDLSCSSIRFRYFYTCIVIICRAIPPPPPRSRRAGAWLPCCVSNDNSGGGAPRTSLAELSSLSRRFERSSAGSWPTQVSSRLQRWHGTLISNSTTWRSRPRPRRRPRD